MKTSPLLDAASILTLLLTFVLFVGALLTKGATEELLLEGGVFLVSMKLVLGNLRTHRELAAVRRELAALSARA
jgi:hypothetical protein